jgi:hypothetical protein
MQNHAAESPKSQVGMGALLAPRRTVIHCAVGLFGRARLPLRGVRAFHSFCKCEMIPGPKESGRIHLEVFP